MHDIPLILEDYLNYETIKGYLLIPQKNISLTCVHSLDLLNFDINL